MFRKTLPLLLFMILACRLLVQGQSSANILALEEVIQQDFNFLPDSGAVGVSALPQGWFAQRGTNFIQGIIAYNGQEREDSLLSLGNNGDRALGIHPDNDVYYVNWKLVNGSPKTIYKMYMQYKGEQWSVEEYCNAFGCSPAENRIDFGYKVNPTSNVAANVNVTEVPALRFESPNQGSSGDVNGNLDANSEILSSLIEFEEGLAPGDSIFLRWEFTSSEPANNLAIDSVRVYFFDNTWYLESNATDLAAASWTPFSDRQSAAVAGDGRPEMDPSGFDEDQQILVIGSLQVQHSGSLTISGADAYLLLEEGADVQLSGDLSGEVLTENNVSLSVSGDYTGNMETADGCSIEVDGATDGTVVIGSENTFVVGGLDSDGLYTIGENATLTFERPVSSFLEIDSAYAGSTLNLYINPDDGHAHIPDDVSYHNLGLYGNGSGWGFTYAFSENDPLVLRGGFHYDNASNDLFYNDLHIRVSGDSCVFDIPNYSGEGMLASLTVEASAMMVVGNCMPDSSGTGVWDVTGNSFADNFVNNGAVLISEDAGLRIDMPVVNNGDWVIEEGGALTIEDATLTNGGTFYVEDGGSIIQNASSTLVNTGTFYVTRLQPGHQGTNIFNYWSSPVDSGTVGIGGDLTGSRHYYYTQGEDDNADFVRFYQALTMNPAQGYAVLGSPGAVFSGTINNGTIAYDIKEGSQDSDNDDFAFNLIGNPYPSAISAYRFIEENAVQNEAIYGTIKVFSQSQSNPSQLDRQADYIAINVLGATDPEPVTGGDFEVISFDDYLIPSGQGFFVVAVREKANGNGNGNDNGKGNGNGNSGNNQPDGYYVDKQVRFTNDMRGGINTNFKSGSDLRNLMVSRFWLQVSDQHSYKNCLLGFVEGASLGEDRLFDSPNGTSTALDLWTEIKGKQYEIQGLPPVEEITTFIPVGMRVEREGMHHLKILHMDRWPEGQPVFLFDRKLGVFHDLGSSPYAFYPGSVGEVRERFFLAFVGSGGDDKEATGISDAATVNPVQFAPNGLVRVLQDPGSDAPQFFTSLGKQVAGWQWQNGLWQLKIQSPGVYVLRYTYKGETRVEKFEYLGR